MASENRRKKSILRLYSLDTKANQLILSIHFFICACCEQRERRSVLGGDRLWSCEALQGARPGLMRVIFLDIDGVICCNQLGRLEDKKLRARHRQ